MKLNLLNTIDGIEVKLGDVVYVLEFTTDDGIDHWRHGTIQGVGSDENGDYYFINIDDFVYRRTESEVKIALNSSMLDKMTEI